MQTLEHDACIITLMDEPAYLPGSSDNVRTYEREIGLGDEGRWLFSSRHGVRLEGRAGQASCILLASGGATGVHERTACIVDDVLHVACGPFLTALTLPRLAPLWTTQVDDATCFGVYDIPRGLITHGELAIARLDLDGTIRWGAHGRDMLTGDFELEAGHARVVDWNGDVYCFSLKTGRSM